MIHDAVMKACGGAADNFLEDPTRCTWAPSSIACHGPSAPDCLTEDEVGRGDAGSTPARMTGMATP